MDDAFDVIKKWIPIVDASSIDTTFLDILAKEYVQRIMAYEDILNLEDNINGDVFVSGFVFFYGCISYIIHVPNWGGYIEDVLLYNLLYILVDNYLDGNSITKEAITHMHMLIEDPSVDVDIPILRYIARIYHALLTRRPKIKFHIRLLFQAEIEGLYVQRQRNLSRETYYNIALKKGGLTMNVLHQMVDDDLPINEAYQLGEIMQLLDDSLDVFLDRENAIHTVATYDLERGYLDNIWKDICHRINDISSNLIIYKIIYSAFAIYLIYNKDTSVCYSDELRSMVAKYSIPEGRNTSKAVSLALVRAYDDLKNTKVVS